MCDIVTFGSATVDIFIESNDADIVTVKNPYMTKELYCLNYGEKIEIDHQSFAIGGGAINTAACFSKLGFNVAAAVKVGSGANADFIKEFMKENNMSTEFVMKAKEGIRTGFSIILTSFEGDRTVLAHRGANVTIKPEDIEFDKIKEVKWIYSAPLNSKYCNLIEYITKFAEDNNIKIAHNLGGRELDFSIEELSPILKRLNILSLNTQEATKITKIEQKYTKSKSPINDDVKQMLHIFKEYVKDVVVITDGKKGAYAFDGKSFYYAPIYPSKRVSTLGAGDAFASTFTAYFIKYDKDIERALKAASINSASVVKDFSAQKGLLTKEEIEDKLEKTDKHHDYKVQKFDE